jgi:hypothetical protein
LAVLATLLLPDLEIEGGQMVFSLTRSAFAGLVAGMTYATTRPAWPAPLAGAVAATLSILVFAVKWPALPVGPALIGIPFAALISFGVAWVREAVSVQWAKAVCVCVVLVAALWVGGILPSSLKDIAGGGRIVEMGAPRVAEGYRFDGDVYLRAQELMRRGGSYYESFRTALIGDQRYEDDAELTVFNYREPLVFAVWRVLPANNGYHLFLWFYAFSLVALVVGYLIACELVDPGPALLAPAGLLGLWVFMWWVSTWFTMTEVWASLFAMAAVWSLLRRWHVASVVLLSLAVATREFMLLLIPAWVVWWLLGRERRTTVWLPITAVVAPLMLLTMHFALVPDTKVGASTISTWLNGGLAPLVATLRFGSTYVPFGEVTALAIPVLALAGAVVQPDVRMRWTLLTLNALPLVFLWGFSSGLWGDYWGTFYTPLALCLAPGALAVVPSLRASKHSAELDRGIGWGLQNLAEEGRA